MKALFSSSKSKQQNQETATARLQGLLETKNVDVNTIQKLINEGADPYVTNAEGLSAFDNAINFDLKIAFLLYKEDKITSAQKALLDVKAKAFIEKCIEKQNYKECSDLLVHIKAHAAFKYLNTFVQKEVLSQGKAILDKEGDNVTEFLNFLDKKPPLGDQFENSFAKLAIDYAYLQYKKHPELLRNILNLVKEHKANENDFCKKTIEYLNTKSLEGLTAPEQIAFETVVYEYDQFFNHKNAALSVEDINNLSVFAKNAAKIEHLVPGMKSMEKSDIIAMHYAYQELKGKLSEAMFKAMDASLIEQTDKFVNWHVAKKDLKTLNEFAEHCADSKNYLKHVEDTFDGKRDIKTQAHLQEYFSWKIANDIMQQKEEVPVQDVTVLREIFNNNVSKLSLEAKESFNEFFERVDSNSQSKITARQVEMIANCTENSQDISKLQELAGALNPLSNNGQLAKKQLEEFTKFLDEKPLLGDIQVEDGLAERAFNIAQNSIATNPELMEKVVDLAKNEYKASNNTQALKELSMRLQDFSISSDNDEIRKKIAPSIDKMSSYLRHDSESGAQDFITNGLQKKDYTLVSKLIVENHGYNLDLATEDVVQIINHCSEDALAVVMPDKDKVASYLTELQAENNKEIKLIWEHAQKNNMSLSLNEESVGKIASALNVADSSETVAPVANLEKQENLKKLIRNCTAEKEDREKLVNVVLSKIDQQDLTAILKDFYKKDKVEDDECLKLVANSVLKNNPEQFVLLKEEQIDKLVKYYNPHEHSSKFLDVVLDNKYEQAKFGGATKENTSLNFANIVIDTLKNTEHLSLQEGKVTDAEKGARVMMQRYFDKKRQYETQPIWTRVKAFCQGYKLEDYKARKLLSARDAIATELKKEELKNSARVPANTKDVNKEEGLIKHADRVPTPPVTPTPSPPGSPKLNQKVPSRMQ